MVDAIQVLPAGFRITDAADNPLSGAKIKFREVGPGATRTVYSDKELSTALGHTVHTRSDGMPVVSEGSNTTVLIYTGNTPYHVEITDADDVPIFPAKDNVLGALDTSLFALAADSSTLVVPVLSKTANYTVQEADKGKLIAANASGGFFTVTLPSAVTVGDGWNIGIRNDGSANQVGVTSPQAVALSMGGQLNFTLRPGETIWLESNGATYKQSGYTPPLISTTYGVIVIEDILSAPPGAPSPGDRYLVGAAPTGAWSSFAEDDIAEADGQGGWFKITPAANIGWLAYDKDGDATYQFRTTGWEPVTPPATDALAGLVQLASQGEMEARDDSSLAVTAGRQHFHPGHPKAGGNLVGTATPPVFLTGDVGMGAIVDNGTGNYTVGFDTSFNSTDFWCTTWVRSTNGSFCYSGAADDKGTGNLEIRTLQHDNNLQDAAEVGLSFWGDYA